MLTSWESYTAALALTLAAEVPIYAVVLVRLYQRRLPAAAGSAVLANLATHPIVWFVLLPLLEPRAGHTGYVIIAELFAWWAEWLLLFAWTRRFPRILLLTSLLANGTSVLVGWLLLWAPV